jgi:rod shape determining protein RodA
MFLGSDSFGSSPDLRIVDKLAHLSWGLILLVCAIAAIGVMLLYSAGGGSWEPWASRHAVRFGIGFIIMLTIALVDLRVWLRLAYPLYAVMLVMLVGVELMGHIGKGAERWINLGFIQIQPSELMKITLTLALARYFHSLPPDQTTKLSNLLLPMLLIFMPVGLVLLQPNLGTALLLCLASAMVFWGTGVPKWMFATAATAAAVSVPLVWPFLFNHQKQRILTFLNPEADPLGTGYNIMQSKIAFGSGGLLGKGFLNGSQSQLAFLPEKHTDFIFVVLAEEFGMVGALILLSFYTAILIYGFSIALTSRSHFGRLLALGITAMLFLYVVVNIAMITGLIPVVGIPLPLVSYGGTAMLTLLIGIGLLLCVAIHREVRLSKSGLAEW